jgi:hypothetical protein
VVVGWDDEVTLQIEGIADKPTGADRDRCLAAYFEQYPDGRRWAEDLDITHFRVRLRWARRADFRPGTWESRKRFTSSGSGLVTTVPALNSLG